MAQIREIRLVDDLDGGPADDTVQFALNGTVYEIDLSDDNVKAMTEAFNRYVEAGRVIGKQRKAKVGHAVVPTRAATSGARTVRDREQTKAIRDWAKARGMKVNDRGRISAEVMERYEREA